MLVSIPTKILSCFWNLCRNFKNSIIYKLKIKNKCHIRKLDLIFSKGYEVYMNIIIIIILTLSGVYITL